VLVASTGLFEAPPVPDPASPNGSEAPEVPPLGSGIDAELWEYVRPLVDEGRWEQVAREAAAFVETRTRQWTGSDKEALDSLTRI
jgi:hypothetical protein